MKERTTSGRLYISLITNLIRVKITFRLRVVSRGKCDMTFSLVEDFESWKHSLYSVIFPHYEFVEKFK